MRIHCPAPPYPWGIHLFQDPQWMPETTSSTESYGFSIYIYTYDKVYQLGSVREYTDFQCHYSCTLGTLSSKIRVIWTQALWCCESQSDKIENTACTQGCLVLGRIGQKGRRFYQASKNSVQFKAYELLMSGTFHLIFLHHGWPQVSEVTEGDTMDQEGPLYWEGFGYSHVAQVFPRMCWGSWYQNQCFTFAIK